MFLKYFLLFISYSFLGWLIEVVNVLVREKKLINRGFFIGPYCPIYGCGAIIMLLTLKDFTSKPLALFIMSIVIFSLLEYYTSYFMEKIFKARWWDYSKRKFNINGRICLETMVPFGILGCFTMYVINSFFERILYSMSPNLITLISVILLVIFVIDLIISFKIISGFKKVSVSIAKDSTEEITRRVREILYKKSILSKRLLDSFPYLKSMVNKIKINKKI